MFNCRALKGTFLISFGFVALLATGCASSKPLAVRVESNPPGARVFVSYHPLGAPDITTAELIGTAPCVAHVRAKANREVDPENKVFAASDFMRPGISFIAQPPAGASGTNQIKTLRGGALFYPGDRLPESIFFDFTR